MMLGMSVSSSGYGHRLSGSRSPKTAIRRKSFVAFSFVLLHSMSAKGGDEQ
jgi:hypothetical protein